VKALIILALALLLVSCNTVRDEITNPTDDLPDSEGYYSTQNGSFKLRYKVVTAGLLDCILSANTVGWVAVGFDPSSQMRDANFIIGNVVSGTGFVRDDFGNSNSSHLSDTDLGGTNDVTLISASETGGVTTLNFTLPLNSGDQYDRVINPGSSYQVIFASGAEDDPDSYHNSLGTGTVKIRGE
jgi:hypothetical protein